MTLYDDWATATGEALAEQIKERRAMDKRLIAFAHALKAVDQDGSKFNPVPRLTVWLSSEQIDVLAQVICGTPETRYTVEGHKYRVMHRVIDGVAIEVLESVEKRLTLVPNGGAA